MPRGSKAEGPRQGKKRRPIRRWLGTAESQPVGLRICRLRYATTDLFWLETVAPAYMPSLDECMLGCRLRQVNRPGGYRGWENPDAPTLIETGLRSPLVSPAALRSVCSEISLPLTV